MKSLFSHPSSTQVDDMNDNPPQLNAVSYEGSLSEGAVLDTIVYLSPVIKVRDYYIIK